MIMALFIITLVLIALRILCFLSLWVKDSSKETWHRIPFERGEVIPVLILMWIPLINICMMCYILYRFIRKAFSYNYVKDCIIKDIYNWIMYY